jgi:hypothetical protein
MLSVSALHRLLPKAQFTKSNVINAVIIDAIYKAKLIYSIHSFYFFLAAKLIVGVHDFGLELFAGIKTFFADVFGAINPFPKSEK